jgi:hypothetical protein
VLNLAPDMFKRQLTQSFPERPKSFTHIIATNKRGAPLLERASCDDQSAGGFQADFRRWVPALWAALGVGAPGDDGSEGAPRVRAAEALKTTSNSLRGTIAQGLRDESTGLQALCTQLRGFRASGPGKEVADVQRLLRAYQAWQSKMVPGLTLLEMLQQLDKGTEELSKTVRDVYVDELRMAEFLRVLRDDGFVVITCPDLQSVAALVAEDRLTEPAYVSPAGPIAPLDILYGHRPAMAAGNLYMAHRCGFTENVLVGSLSAAGFTQIASLTRPAAFDLWALATTEPWADQHVRAAAARLLPST